MCQEPIWIGYAMQGKSSRGVGFLKSEKRASPSRDTLPAKVFAFCRFGLCSSFNGVCSNIRLSLPTRSLTMASNLTRDSSRMHLSP